jgi:hypothetical protein
MHVFLDFEASSLSDDSYPIEVAWVFEDGRGESYLIHPADGWNDWGATAEAIHGIERARLFSDGTPVETVAARMIAALSGHDLAASAPSWDGKWISVLLRGAGMPRHALRLRDTDEIIRESVAVILSERLPAAAIPDVAGRVMRALENIDRPQPAHRAMADAAAERERWIAACDLAVAERNTWRAPG